MSVGSQKFQELKGFSNTNGPVERERIEYSRSLILWLGEALWTSDKKVTHEEVVTLMMGTFYSLDNETEALFEKLPQEIRKRNVLLSSYLIGVLLSCGYYDFEYLKDSFNICLFLDYKLCFEMWNKEEKSYLVNVHNSSNDKLINKGYVKENITKYKEKLLKSLKMDDYYLGTLKVLDFYCERLNGSGAPFGVDYNNLSDLELSVILLLRGTNDEDIQDFNRSADGHYKKMIEEKQILLSKRIVEYLKQSFDRGDQEGFLKVAGL